MRVLAFAALPLLAALTSAQAPGEQSRSCLDDCRAIAADCVSTEQVPTSNIEELMSCVYNKSQDPEIRIPNLSSNQRIVCKQCIEGELDLLCAGEAVKDCFERIANADNDNWDCEQNRNENKCNRKKNCEWVGRDCRRIEKLRGGGSAHHSCEMKTREAQCNSLENCLWVGDAQEGRCTVGSPDIVDDRFNSVGELAAFCMDRFHRNEESCIACGGKMKSADALGFSGEYTSKTRCKVKARKLKRCKNLKMRNICVASGCGFSAGRKTPCKEKKTGPGSIFNKRRL